MWFPDRPFKGGWVKLSFQISTNDPIYNPPHYVQVIQGGNTASHQLSQVWSSGNRWETSFKLQASGNSIQLILYNEAGITNDNHTLGWIVPIRDLGDGELADSDNDGLPDEWEELYGLDPLDDGSLNPDNGANGDPDGDGLKNSEELLYGLNPIEYDDILWDADGDGIPLIVEIQRGTDPHDPDDYPEPDYLIPAGETNITTAIEQAVALNTNDYTIIQFEPGVYTYGSAGYVFEVNSDKVIFVGSMNHADPVIIDAEETGRCITVLGNNVSISGFVLRNGVSYTTYPGGGIRAYNSRLAVNNCFFENCLTDITPVGAAIYATGCNLTLVNCVFIGNGGGGKTIYTSGGTLRMRHCTMTDNDGGLDATGSLSQTPSEVDIKSSIFWNTGATPLILPQFPVPLVADSCIEGGYVGGSNIYTNDPNFVNGWRLEGAQSVDIINYTASDVIYDIDGEFRGEYADLGADEWVVDSDGDGLPDWWEIANGLDPFDDGTIDPANGYGADPDNDGWSNAQEMRAGTMATNSDTDGDGVIDSYDPEPLIFNCFIEQEISFNLQAFDKPFADGSGAPVYAGSVFATPVFPSIVATITQVRLTGHVDDCFKINNKEYAWGRTSKIFQEDITDSVLDRKAGRFRVDVYDYIDDGWQNNEVHLLDSGAGPAGALCTIRYLTGLRVDIIQPYSLWWAPTTLPGGYHDADVAEARIDPASWAGQGTFKWDVVGAKGYGALGLIPSGGGSAQAVTKTDNEYVNIFTKGYSDNEGDVTLRLTYTPPGASAPACSVEKTITVRTFKLALEGVQHFANGTGWRTWRDMSATDQFDDLIPSVIDINELFTDWQTFWSGETWPPPVIQGGLEDARQWTDNVTMPGPSAYTPDPVTPSDANAATPVDKATQTWRYGTVTQGAGDAFIGGAVNFQRNLGFAEHSH